MMKRYYLRVRALSPLSITGHQNVAGQAGATLNYIPGTTLRGALAWQVLTARPDATQEATFQQLFGPDGLRCGPLYPLSRATKPGADITLPLPLTARTCKRQAGFASDPDPRQAPPRLQPTCWAWYAMNNAQKPGAARPWSGSRSTIRPAAPRASAGSARCSRSNAW
jgi:hypothetical protein